jgi:hypothetical protein
MLPLAIKALLALTPGGVLLSLLLAGVLPPEVFMVGCLGGAIVLMVVLLVGLERDCHDMEQQLAANTRDLFATRRVVSILQQDVQRLLDAEIL